MNDNTKIEMSREIMNVMIARQCRNGFNKNDKFLRQLLKEEQEMCKFNFKVIDKILTKYAKIVIGNEVK